jgi:8-oxo-dGTP pyrophosphatase MutT (NUDIX family)
MEILMVCKRYTYAFSEFVHGKYAPGNKAVLTNMLDKMTVDEKIDILSLNFDQIHYRIYLNTPKNPTLFAVAKNKFEMNYVLGDNGEKLKKAIANSRNSERIWEIPKGRKKSKNESDIYCAIREFTEETGIKKCKYKIFPDAVRSYSYFDNGINYENKFYIALMNGNYVPKVSFKRSDQIYEISNVKWLSIDGIKFIDQNGRLERFVRPIFHYIKNRTKYNNL